MKSNINSSDGGAHCTLPIAPDNETFSAENHTRFLRSYTTHEAAIRAYVRRLMPSRAETDDVMQEVALILWAKFSEFRPNGDFRKWAFGVARYEVLAWLRDCGRDRLVLAGDVADVIAAEALQNPEQYDSRRAALTVCLEKLAAPQRDLVLASYGSQSKIQDVAIESGRTLAGFYQWLHRMRRLLLNCVQQEVSQPTCP